MREVFIAMSGGADSSFAAYLLKKEGYRVVGVTFTLMPAGLYKKLGTAVCAQERMAQEAKKTAGELSIPHHVIDLSDVFEQRVIQGFINGYRSGITPNPCILCNRFIKFGAFSEKAFSMGADLIATGHYAKTELANGEVLLKKGTDKRKDQSYFLYSIEKNVLERTVFPLGDLSKENLLETARQEGIRLPSSRESQDICFIPGGDYGNFLSHFIKPRDGSVYLSDGTFLGRHKGIHLFTIGQRRGIGVPFSEPLYVLDIRPEENVVVVGTKKELDRSMLTARSVHMLYPVTDSVRARVRYRQREQACTCEIHDDTLHVKFNDPVGAVTPGQSVVLYKDDIVVGGGVIEKRIEIK